MAIGPSGPQMEDIRHAVMPPEQLVGVDTKVKDPATREAAKAADLLEVGAATRGGGRRLEKGTLLGSYMTKFPSEGGEVGNSLTAHPSP